MSSVASELRKLATPAKAKASSWFFKSGPGQYGEGDKFLGVTVPEQRKIAKQFKDLPLSEVEKLITSPWHEERLTGLFILVGQYQRGSEADQQKIFEFYLCNSGPTGRKLVMKDGPLKQEKDGVVGFINNWDLVDSSAEFIVGSWLMKKPEKMETLLKLANSDFLWEKRIAMIATFAYIKEGQADEALIIARKLLDDPHDLIQKAVGWMLRELGKRVDRELLINFLDEYAATMPRTSLRYAIEHLPADRRQHFLSKKLTLS